MERKRKLGEAIKKNDQAAGKKMALVCNQTWDALDANILAKIFDRLPFQELFWNVSLVCRVWQLSCWDKLFWNNDGWMDLSVVAPFQCCRNDDDKSTSSMPKEYHNHACSELMKHLLQTIVFGTHDAFGNSLEEWRNSIRTIRIPFGLEMCDDFLFSLPCAAVVVAEPRAPGAKVRPLMLSNLPEPNRPLEPFPFFGVREEVLSWNLKRLLLESPLFGKPIFTDFLDVNHVNVFEYILRCTFKGTLVDLEKVLYDSQLVDVLHHCVGISLNLESMIRIYTNCGILPRVQTVAEHRYYFQHPKARKFPAKSRTCASFSLPFDDESRELACQWRFRCQIREFWAAVKNLFSDDKKNLSLAWETCEEKSVFMDHYYKVAETCCSHLAPLALKRAAEIEWDSLLVREGVKKAPKKMQILGSPDVAETIEIRKNIFPYSKYQEIAMRRREFVKKLVEVNPLYLPCHLTQDEWASGVDYRPQHIRGSLVLLKAWGGGPYEYLERKHTEREASSTDNSNRQETWSKRTTNSMIRSYYTRVYSTNRMY